MLRRGEITKRNLAFSPPVWLNSCMTDYIGISVDLMNEAFSFLLPMYSTHDTMHVHKEMHQQEFPFTSYMSIKSRAHPNLRSIHFFFFMYTLCVLNYKFTILFWRSRIRSLILFFELDQCMDYFNTKKLCFRPLNWLK